MLAHFSFSLSEQKEISLLLFYQLIEIILLTDVIESLIAKIGPDKTI